MVDFKEVVEKANKICEQYAYCSSKCPLYEYNCPINYDSNIDEMVTIIVDYKIEGEE